MAKGRIITGYICIIVSAVIFGCMPLMATHIYDDGVSSMSLVFFRNALSFPVLAAVALLTKKSLKIQKKAIPSLSLLALMGCFITPMLLFSSYKFIPSGTATVFHFIYPAVVVLSEMLFLKNKAKLTSIVSLILCVVGIFLFYTPGQELNITGSIFALLSGITYAVYILLLASFKYKEISGTVFTFYVALICAAAMLITCIFSGQLTFPQTPTGWLLCTLFAVSVNVGGVFLFQRGALLIGGQRAAILSTFEPITSIFVGALFLEETIGLRTGLGAVLVILASILIALGDIKSAKNSEKTNGDGT